MYLIKESPLRKNTFSKYLIDRNTKQKIHLDDITIESYIKEYPKRTYTILFHNDKTPIHGAFEYINYEIKEHSPNTKSQVASALRLLYSFLELFNLDLESLNDQNIQNLIYFLKGFSPRGNYIEIDLSTDRSNETINIYLSIYRKYVEFLNLKDHNLLKTTGVSKKIVSPHTDLYYESKRFKNHQRVNKNKTVPHYISVPEYEKILEVIRKEYTLREECIVRLMFEGGLRIGEVLGLTSEDLKSKHFFNQREEIEYDMAVVYFRNRVSDKNFQLAKGRMIADSKRVYSTKAYKKDTTTTFISMDLLETIDRYIEGEHPDCMSLNQKEFSSTFKKNYAKYTITDIVDKNDNIDKDGFDILEENFYIFINNVGKPLHKSSWNKILREIFQKCDIKVDKVKRQKNLNHRFRHGFAMFLLYYKKVSMAELMRLMRHNSISSTAIYNNPTTEDLSLLKYNFSKSLEHLIPTVTERWFDEIAK